MKTFQIVSLFALIASAMAFAPMEVSKVAAKVAVGAFPVAALAPAAFAADSVIEQLPTETVGLIVQQGGFLAVILGVLLPTLFLINLFIQTESRAAGRAGGQDAE